MGFIDAKNTVPEKQRFYQAAYKSHTRIWKINPRGGIFYTPFVVAMYGAVLASTYGMGRRVLGYNSWFGKD